MESNSHARLLFIYDGKCPFCNQFAELLELKSNLPNIEIQDARKNSFHIPAGYDMDVQGAILKNGNEFLSGADAINYICSRIEMPSDSLLKILGIVFSSSRRTNFIFPFLLVSRRIALFFSGVPRKLVIQPKYLESE
tara:strand:+ start:99 stop:509 length:411 start_codon:yes stop_codon:yes gene_type:complete